MNLVILIGNVGTEPENKVVNGKTRTSFKLATNSVYRDKTTKELVKTTQWHKVVAWDGTAELIIRRVKVGSKLMVKGEIKYYFLEKDGVKTNYADILIEKIEFISSIKNESPNKEEVDVTNDEDLDLPF